MRIFIFILLLVLPVSVAAWAVVSGILFNPTEIHETGAHPLDVDAQDINNDGYIDVLTANRDGRSISVFMGNGDGTLTEIDSIPTDLGATSLALADMNSDTILDIVVSLCNAGCSDNAVMIYLGLGDGRFEPGAFIASSGVPYNVAIADLNSDNIPDIVATDYPGSKLLVYLSTAMNSAYEEISLPTGRKPISLRVIDLNNDDVLDIISSDHGADSSSVYLNLGDGTFSDRIVIETGDLPYSIALDYLDDDNFLDLAVAHSSSPGGISFYRGNGDGTFSPAGDLNVDDSLVYIETGDFNLDGLADIITTRHKKKYASVYLNNGSGTNISFETEDIQVTAENNIYSLAVAHLNDDRFPDLITVDYDQNTLSVSLGTMLSN